MILIILSHLEIICEIIYSPNNQFKKINKKVTKFIYSDVCSVHKKRDPTPRTRWQPAIG